MAQDVVNLAQELTDRALLGEGQAYLRQLKSQPDGMVGQQVGG